MNKVTKTVLLTSLLATQPYLAHSELTESEQDIVDAGDVLQWALPLAAYGTTAIYKDWEGTKQYTYSLGTTVILTSLMKDTAEKMRPSSASKLSFPSGHTSAAFSAAAFVDTRYGHAWGVPFYALAAFTGYSRVVADAHHVDDVLAGMSVALFSNWYWVKPRNTNVAMVPIVVEDGVGVGVNVTEQMSNSKSISSITTKKYPEWSYEMLFGPASLQQNFVQAPAATGTEFNLFDFDKINDPTTTANIIVKSKLNKHHSVAFSVSPFEARDTGQFTNPVDFAGDTYPANTDLVSAYRRTDLRLDYVYDLIPDRKGTIGVGASLAGLRTVVELATADATIANKVDEWVVTGLLHLELAYPLSSRWEVWGEVNGANWSDIEHVDSTLMFYYQFDKHWRGGIGRGEYNSKLDTAELKNDLQYNIFKLSVAYTF